MSNLRLAHRIDALLPQTQCTQCGYDGCRPYADAIAAGDAAINRCPPGGDEGIAALAGLLGQDVLPLDESCGGFNGFHLAVIEEKHCIGCTLCITACPVDAIVGANKRMHTVLDDWCTGCELCLPACPVDCITMVPAGRAWQLADADQARLHHQSSQARRLRLRQASQQQPVQPPAPVASTASDVAPDVRKQAVIADALARARARRAAHPQGIGIMNQARREEMFARFQAANPHPTTELEYASHFQLLIAVLLSAQATDKSVNIATRRFFPEHGTAAGLVALGEEGVAEYIKTIGLFRTKAKNAVATSRILLAQYGGEVPADRAALEALPGVGRKTANVVLNTAFGMPTIAVDTHIFRVSNRTGLAPGKDVVAVEERLERVVPRRYKQDAHHWLILHGRYVCVARKPKCPQCGVADLCDFKEKTPA